ncbi:MAG: sensor histidine kinase [Pseudomonadales bacterium]
MRKTKSLRRTLISYALAFTTLSALFYIFLIANFADLGINKIFDSILRVEARSFERAYRENPNQTLTGSGTINFYLDSWEGAPHYIHDFPPIAELKVGENYDLIDYFDAPQSIVDAFESDREVIAYIHQLPDGRKLAVVSNVQLSILTESEIQEFDALLEDVLLSSLLFSLIVIGLFLLFSRHLFKQTNKLTQWVEQLNVSNLDSPVPNLHYAEFALIANKLQQSVDNVAQLVRKERHLLRNISHELRTPIAVVNANLSLLKRNSLAESATTPLKRIDRANKSMQLMTETLLWVHRESETPPKRELISCALLVQQQLEHYRYLIQGKEVTLSFNVDAALSEQWTFTSPLEIVVGNLIRNALQHTESGAIAIHLEQQSLSIVNQYSEDYRTEYDSFGLGIGLVQQICEKLNWHFEVTKSQGGFSAMLRFGDE